MFCNKIPVLFINYHAFLLIFLFFNNLLTIIREYFLIFAAKLEIQDKYEYKYE